MEPRQEVERLIRPKEPRRHCQNSKLGTKTQRTEKPSSPTLKTVSQNSKKRKPSSPTLKVKGWNKSTHKLQV